MMQLVGNKSEIFPRNIPVNLFYGIVNFKGEKG
jgi:hypothetical protein